MHQVTFSAFVDEMQKLSGARSFAAKWLEGNVHPIEVAGLGALAVPSIDNIQARIRARKARSSDDEKFRLLKGNAHDAIEVGGLAGLALPSIGHMLTKGK